MAADQNPCNIGLAFVLDDEPKDGILICRTLNAVGIDARRFNRRRDIFRSRRTRVGGLVCAPPTAL